MSQESRRKLDDYIVISYVPADLSPSELKTCLLIVEQGSAVDIASAQHELPQAEVIAIARKGNEIVGIGSIKRQRRKYALSVSERGQFVFDSSTHELGYVAVDRSHQGNRLSHRILEALIAKHKEPLFATTDDDRMKRSLERAGFKRRGKDWDGTRGQLSLWFRD